MTVHVSIVAPIVARYDAISRAAINTWRMIDDTPGYSATLFSGGSDFPDLPIEFVADSVKLLRHPKFRAADAIIYSYGIYSPFQDVMLIGNGHARQIVRFHNVTPAKFLPAHNAPIIQKSLKQMFNFSHADAIWADSPVNAEMLREHGIGHPSLEVLPLVVDTPERSTLAEKKKGRIKVLYVGRMVQSKGIKDLVSALIKVKEDNFSDFELQIAGNQTFSDTGYVAETLEMAKHLGNNVTFLGEIEQDHRDRLLKEAHVLAIPSYHEGFCIPVVEALRAGCIPVGYAAYNIPNVCRGFGRLAATGNINELAIAFRDVFFALNQHNNGTSNASKIPLDRGATTVDERDRLIDAHITTFEPDVVAQSTLASLSRILQQTELKTNA